MYMCPVHLGTKRMQTQVGYLVFLKTSMSTDCSILKISALGFFARSIRLRTDFTIHEINNLYCTPAKCTFFNHDSRRFRPLELE